MPPTKECLAGVEVIGRAILEIIEIYIKEAERQKAKAKSQMKMHVSNTYLKGSQQRGNNGTG